MNVWVVAIHGVVIGDVLQIPSSGIQAKPTLWGDVT
jgi:hypothetical protein